MNLTDGWQTKEQEQDEVNSTTWPCPDPCWKYLVKEAREENEDTKKNKINLKMAVTSDAHIAMVSLEKELLLKLNFL